MVAQDIAIMQSALTNWVFVWRNLASTRQIFMKFDRDDFYKNLSLEIQILSKSDQNTGHFK
jgi:hypothetical protein